MEVAIACDMVVASKASVFGQPEIKLGFLPPYAAVRLPPPCRTVQSHRDLHYRPTLQRRGSL